MSSKLRAFGAQLTPSSVAHPSPPAVCSSPDGFLPIESPRSAGSLIVSRWLSHTLYLRLLEIIFLILRPNCHLLGPQCLSDQYSFPKPVSDHVTPLSNRAFHLKDPHPTLYSSFSLSPHHLLLGLCASWAPARLDSPAFPHPSVHTWPYIFLRVCPLSFSSLLPHHFLLVLCTPQGHLDPILSLSRDVLGTP